MRNIFIVYILLIFGFTYSQSEITNDTIFKKDKYYLEDQLYFGVSYIILKNLPEDLLQNGFSNQIKFGFIRDIPLNEKRNFGLGIGLGYSRDTYYHNLRINVNENDGSIQYHILTDENYKTNSFTVRKIDIPFEFRLRGSTPEKFKFWRLYAGITAHYNFYAESEFSSTNIDVAYKNLDLINRWTYGLNISVGYGIWNFNFYYGLSDIIKKGILFDNKELNMKTMNLGVVYYFL